MIPKANIGTISSMAAQKEIFFSQGFYRINEGVFFSHDRDFFVTYSEIFITIRGGLLSEI